MFKLLAILYLISNGQVSPVPTMTLTSGSTFETEELCMNFFDTDIGKASKNALDARIKADENAYKVEFKCVQREDNTI